MAPATAQTKRSDHITKDLALKVLAAILFTLLTGIAGYVAATLTRLTDSVGILNERMAVVAVSVAEQKTDVGDLLQRVRALELKTTTLPDRGGH